MTHPINSRWYVNTSQPLRWRSVLRILVIVLVAAFAQACTQMLDDDFPGGTDIGGGIVTPPPAPSGPMAVDVRVVSDPQGGSYVSELSCVLEVSEIPGGGTNPIVITVNWVAPCGTHKSEVFVFDGGTKTYESTYSENGRTILLTFWTTISWKDSQGNHQIRSGMAACT